MAWAVHVRVVALLRLVLHVRGGNGNTTSLLFGRVIDLVNTLLLGFHAIIRQGLKNSRREGGFPMVNVTNGSDVHVWLTAVK